jgi:hypothetical protein
VKQQIKTDFDEIGAAYPECTAYVTSDITLDVQAAPPVTVNATIESYGSTPNGQPRYLLTVWDPVKTKPLPKPMTLTLGPPQIGDLASKTNRP